MEDNEDIYDEEFLDHGQDQVEAMGGLEQAEEKEEEYIKELQQSKPHIHTSFRTKLIEILKSLLSAEVTIYSEASKEFVGLLEGDAGGNILREYIHLSPKCSEILESWKLHHGKPGVGHILSVLSAIFDHPVAKSRDGGIIIKIHMIAQFILNEKYDDICAELNSQEHRRQNAAMCLLASIVKLGVGLASEVANKFESKLSEISKKLSGFNQKKRGGKDAKQEKRRVSTRRAFVRFAMSFIEAGNPRLLRSIIQQREMYSRVLQALSGDDVETVVYALSTLRDKVLTGGSLVPPGLRSVLFGSMTLEQLSNISGNPMAGPAADLAHEVLVMVCTDPHNGLMPGINLKGNEKRLFELMKKLKATEVAYHKELLLAIVRIRPSLLAAYMDEFPYNLKPHPSSSWFSTVSLVADMISSINLDNLAISITCSHDGPTMDTPELQNILKCIIPRPFTRSVISTGLQHANDLVKHGTLRIVLESLKSLAGLMLAIDSMSESMSSKKGDTSMGDVAYLHGLLAVNFFVDLDKCLPVGGIGCPHTDELETQKWISLKQFIQDEVRAGLPEPQVLLKLLSSSGQKHSKQSGVGLKRRADLPEVGLKKLKPNDTSEDIDIIISGIDVECSNGRTDDRNKVKAESIMQGVDQKNDDRIVIAEIWGLSEETAITEEPSGAENFFQSKLLDVFKFYIRTVPLAIEGSFDFFKILPVDASSMSSYQLQSLLSLLLEYIGQDQGNMVSARAPKFMYRYLHRLINILTYSHDKVIQEQAHVLARTAMISTGAFDQNLPEIDAWLYSLTGHCMRSCTADNSGAETIHHFSAVVSSFICDAVSTIGNHLFRYLDQMRALVSQLGNSNDHSLGFSPLIICVIEKCFRLLESESRTHKLYEKTMISLYACNTIGLILQTQVDTRILSGMVQLILTEKLTEYPTEDICAKSDLCEWRPIRNLLCFAQDVFNEGVCRLLPISESGIKQYSNSFSPVLVKIKELLDLEHDDGLVGIAAAFSSSVICATPDEMLDNFSFFLAITKQHFESYLPFLAWVIYLERGFLASAVDMESELFSSGFDMIEGVISNCRETDLKLFNSNVLKWPGISNLLASTKPASAVALFLYNAPFCALFSAVMSVSKTNSSRKLDILHSNTMLKLLQVKLSNGSLGDFVPSLRIMLFWTNQLLSSFRTSQMISQCRNDVSHNLELFKMCITLVGYLLDHILVVIANTDGLKTLGTSSVGHYIQDVIDLIFQHPIVTFSMSHPHCFSSLGSNAQDIMVSSEKFHPIDCNIMRLLRTVFDFVFSLRKLCSCSSRNQDSPPGLVLSAPKNLVNDFVEMFKLSILKKDADLLLRRFYILHSLINYLSPFELLEVVDWMYHKLEDDISDRTSPFVSAAVSVGLYIMDGAFSVVFTYLQQPQLYSEINWLWDRKVMSFDVSILLNLYHKILEFGVLFRLQCADTCMLKVVTAAYSQRFTKPHPALFPICTQLSMMVTISPMKMIVYCLYPTSKIKGKILLQLIEVSPMHMNLFGKVFLGIIDNDLSDSVLLDKGVLWPDNCNKRRKDSTCRLSNDDLMLLLPAVLSYLMFLINKYEKQQPQLLERIAKLYSSMLLDGFSEWKNYIARDIFQEEYEDLPLTSPDDLRKFCRNTLLGKAITMLHYSLPLSRSRVKDECLLGTFDSIYSEPSLFDQHIHILKNLGSCSYRESLKFFDVVAAKVSFTRLLLLPSESLTGALVMQADGNSEGIWMKRNSYTMEYAKRFIDILVDAFNDIVQNIPSKFDSSCASCSAECYPVFRFLEHYILSNIVQFSMDFQCCLKKSPSVPFLDQFIRSSLRYRFDDPITLRAIRCILVALSEARFSSSGVFTQLFRDPKFILTIAGSPAYSDTSSFIPRGTLLQPLPSILKSIDTSFMVETALDSWSTSDVSPELQSSSEESQYIKLELVKLLRVLYHLKGCQNNFGPTNVDVMKSRDLLSLLLSGYSATMGEIDLEIYHLMHEIETIEGLDSGGIADMDYLWGGSAMKFRNELAFDGLVSSNMEANYEATRERHKMFFRENIPVDSKISMMTAMHLCNDRSSRTAPMLLKRLLEDKFVDTPEKISSSDINMVQGYDPAFILEFSKHSLAMGYLEPTEFCRLGLLAITFVSISSADEELRILGYDCLGKFVEIFEKYQNRPLQLLLTHIQNGITKQWQRIPSVIAIFAAEASLILLDPSQKHFLTLSEYLMRSKTMDLEMIPLFPELLRSGSIHFKTDRLWILRLLYAGLNSDIDAEIYMKHKVVSLLLSFNSSSLVDQESKVLILKIMKKCFKLTNFALCLIKQHGLISWFSSVILFNGERLSGDHKEFSLAVVQFVLKVLNDGISSGVIGEWLQECNLEHLLDLSSHLHTLIVRSWKLLKGNVSLVNSLLSFIVTSWKMSQDRGLKISQDSRIYQPHFTLSLVRLFQLYEVVDVEISSLATSSTSGTGLNIILMSAPVPATTHMDRAIISKLLTRAVPSALQPSFMGRVSANNRDPNLIISPQNGCGQESLVSKLLRWVSASVILGSIFNKSSMMHRIFPSRSENETLQPILEAIVKEDWGSSDKCSSSDEALHIILLFLQQLLGRNCSFLPTVILALCLLLFGNSSNAPEGISDAIHAHCSKIYCPPEVNPSWRWSYDKPWPWRDEDRAQARTARERMEEEQACRSVLLMFSNAMGGKSLGSSFLSCKDVESSGLYEWERDNFLECKPRKKRKQAPV